MRAIQLSETGGPDVLEPAELPVPEPGPGEALVRVAAAGLNFIDTYHRSGAYDLDLPAVPGLEAAGTVEALGDGTVAGKHEGDGTVAGEHEDDGPDADDEIAVGDRVCWFGEPGAYAEYAVVPVHRLVAVPDELELGLAAAVLLQGMTAHFLSHDTYPLDGGDTALVLAAAGGVGHLLVQLAAGRGARVIAVVSTEAKAELAARLGADRVLRYTQQDVPEAVSEATGGRGAEVVYDSVGRATFADSLDCAARRGMVVLYGQSSGPVPPLNPQVLNSRGSLYLTRPSLGDYVATRAELLERAGTVLDAVADGTLELRVDRRFDLADAAEAHRYIEARHTRGKVLLLP